MPLTRKISVLMSRYSVFLANPEPGTLLAVELTVMTQLSCMESSKYTYAHYQCVIAFWFCIVGMVIPHGVFKDSLEL